MVIIFVVLASILLVTLAGVAVQRKRLAKMRGSARLAPIPLDDIDVGMLMDASMRMDVKEVSA